MTPRAHNREGGAFDAIRYIQRRRKRALRQRKRRRAVSSFNLVGSQHDTTLSPRSDDSDSSVSLPAPKQRFRTNKFCRMDSSGQVTRIYPHTSTWYFLYVRNELIHHDVVLQQQFRNRFRMNYDSFTSLVAMCKGSVYFATWNQPSKNHQQSSIIELLLLGSLRYLGRGWTFDDIEESTAISGETHRRFFHCFIDYGSTVLFNKHVSFPTNFEEAKTHMAEFAVAGFPGCVGSADCTHITMEKCDKHLKNHHTGPKSSHTTRSFSLTANHRRRILHTCTGGPGRWNDQTMVLYDGFIKGMHEGMHLIDIAFKLKEYDRDNKVIETEYRGGYIIVDNGFLSWAITVPPHKHTNDIPSIRWSKWLESMRKDVECTFGILKGRWRILKTGVRVHGVRVVDKVWLTCCALHNMLLDADGIGEEWECGISIEDWLGELGENDMEQDEEHAPAIFDRLLSNLNIRNYDSSGMGPGPDVVETQMEVEDDDNENEFFELPLNPGVIPEVRKLPLAYFRKKLVNHFNILYESGNLIWPRQKKLLN